MPKLNMIVKVEEKEVENYACATTRTYTKCYNQGQEDYGNKSIGLDVGKIKEILNKFPKDSYSYDTAIAQALKDAEDKIIVEVKG